MGAALLRHMAQCVNAPLHHTDNELGEFKQLLKTYLFSAADVETHQGLCLYCTV